jgi:hypothetical protein
MFSRARRSATLRTRLPVTRVLEALRPLAEGGDPDEGRSQAQGWFLGGTLGESSFQLQYRNDGQNYVVTGIVVDEADWRMVRLRLVAREPWMSPWMLGLLPATSCVPLYFGEISLLHVAAMFALFVGYSAITNVFLSPAVAAHHVAAVLASRIRGSIRHGADWIVP